MKALTLTQPWATLVAIGAKKIETRSWRTDYRGPLGIHAAKGPDKSGAVVTEPFWSTLKAAGLNPLELPTGVIVAACELLDCVRVGTESGIEKGRFISHMPKGLNGPWFAVPPAEPELSFGDYTPGRYAWLLANIQRPPQPIPARGSLGLWDWDYPLVFEPARPAALTDATYDDSLC